MCTRPGSGEEMENLKLDRKLDVTGFIRQKEELRVMYCGCSCEYL